MTTTHWTEFGIRHMPPMSARTQPAEIPSFIAPLVDQRTAHLAAPVTGITNDGSVRAGLYPLAPTAVSTKPITEAALAFLGGLTSEQRKRACLALDATEWRTWINVHMNFFRHGVMLEDLPPAARELGLGLLRATLSARGYAQARDIMRLNELLAELSESPDEYGEWPYFVSIFGEPSEDEPWGWQIDGHHLNISCVVVGDHMTMTPTFMGSEPCQVDHGPYAGTRVFMTEERTGLDLIRALDDGQAAKAILRDSIHPDDLPPELQHPFDGRMQGGAFHDNVTVPYEGIRATDLTDVQRRMLRTVVGTYVGWTRDGHNQLRMEEVEAHLDETWFAWMGSTADGPFYYRVQSPVVLVEFDHHPGVVFDNEVPSRNHVHTLIRTPNGGDYGTDLLRQHHDRYDHSHGHHEARH
jgi:Protein of unknown function (DUF3500)